MSREPEKSIAGSPVPGPQIPLPGIPDAPQIGNRVARISAVLLGTLFLLWPAFYNRYPLLFPDSVTYIDNGRPVARALFLHQFSDYYGMRSFIYGLGLLPLHWNITPWPVAFFQAFLAAFVLWLVVRSILPRRTVAFYLVLCALLSVLTSLSWFACLIMPDVLGPLLYLCVFLLVFTREALSRKERVAVAVIAWWGITSHASHLLIVLGLCFLLSLLALLRRPLMAQRWRGLAEVGVVLLLAAASQVALHAYLFDEPSLNGERPPYLMARIIADGPGRWYLEQHCPQASFAVCDYVHSLPDDADEILWGEKGIMEHADDDLQRRLRQEEMPFALATLRAYPRALLLKTADNFWQQLITFDLWYMDPNNWMSEALVHSLKGGRASFLRSRQAQNALPTDFFAAVAHWTVLASTVMIALFLPLLWRWRNPRLAGLSVVIISTVIGNAFVTGTLSMVEDRYQCRVVWLLPLLAILLLLNWCSRWGKSAIDTPL